MISRGKRKVRDARQGQVLNNLANIMQGRRKVSFKILLGVVLSVLFTTSYIRLTQWRAPSELDGVHEVTRKSVSNLKRGKQHYIEAISIPDPPVSVALVNHFVKLRRLRDTVWSSGDIRVQSDLPNVYRTNPHGWKKNGRVKVCVFSRTPRQDSLFRTQVMSMFGSGKYSYSVLSSTACQHLGTCASGIMARKHPDCDPSVNPTVRLVERVKCCHHDRFDKVLSQGMRNWDIVFVTGDEFCQTKHIAGKAHFRSYFGEKVARGPNKPRMPQTLPLGPRAEFARIDSNEVKLAGHRQLLFNFVGSLTSPSRKDLSKYLQQVSGTVRNDTYVAHFVPKWHKEITEENGYILPSRYREIVLESKFTLCPLGRNSESYRIYEACEAGSIPVLVMDELYSKHECKDSFRPIVESGAPFIILDSWQDSIEILKEIAKDTVYLQRLQASVLLWYRKYMTTMAKDFETKLEQRFTKRVQHAPAPVSQGVGSVYWPDTQALPDTI